jgi:aryl-alcohol dehydrogenase-like predicted oxidoreductase
MILGTADLSHKLDFDNACRLVARYWELGGREFDTAHTYAHWIPGHSGESERVLGDVLRALGLPLETAQITTKGGHPDNGPLYQRPARYLDAALVRKDLAESLDRLGMPRVHAYLLHRDDASMPVREIAGLLRGIRDDGFASVVGVSNWPLARVRALREQLDGMLVWQNQGSLCAPNWREGPDPSMRRFSVTDFAWAADNHVICACYSSTGNGYFAGDATGGSFDNPDNRALRETVRVQAAERGITPTQLALDWLRQQPGDVRPIVGTTRVAGVEEAMTVRRC